ncbi:MAG TPA: multicopper oxidase domain-containing protein [Blastocatellia bacterium]|nr:multicopper oxidase domain-containing protein [Blastocatellia bacterium]
MTRRLVVVALILLLISATRVLAQTSGAQASAKSLPDIYANPNRTPAGQLRHGVLTIHLEARTGLWYPEAKDGPGLAVQAFGEEGQPLQIPGPLLRVPTGTEIHATIRNAIPGSTLVVHGFHSRPGDAKDIFEVPAGQTRDVRFKAGAAGTYYYYGTTGGLLMDGRPVNVDSQLAGAFIVDPPGQPISPDERIFIIGVWLDPVDNYNPNDPDFKRGAMTFNGLQWPYSERLIYNAGQTVRWRLINVSFEGHPLHLHGFFYQVNSKGDIERDHLYATHERRRAVTEFLPEAGTMTIAWTAERPGNWLFHCHMMGHVGADLRLRPKPAATEHGAHEHPNHATEGMAGLILGIEVRPTHGWSKPASAVKARRQITLIAQEQPGRFDKAAAQGFVLKDGDAEPPANRVNIPGPPIVLTRGEPVAIKVINRLHEDTAVHWHGIELESYFDGVADWGRSGTSTTPIIEPGGAFVAEMTPPRAGTFIYHTHMHNQQLGAGMYGPLIVVEPGQKFDPLTDKILLISVGGPDDDVARFLNGSDKPEPLRLRVGVKYRLRLINITYNNSRLVVSLLAADTPVNWRAMAKDGADLPSAQAVTQPARQPLTVGETRDFEFQPTAAGDLRFEVRSADGTRRILMPVEVR